MRKKLLCILSYILIIGLLTTGCSKGSLANDSNSDSSGSAAESGDAGQASADGSNTAGDSGASGSKDVTNDGNTASDGTDSGQTGLISTSSTITVDKEFTANDLEVGYEDSTATHITMNKSSIEVSGNGASAEGAILTIKDEGTYVLSGSLEDGQIIVDAGEKDKVQLVFNGVIINCTSNAPVYVKSADKVFITLQKGTDNTLTDGTSSEQADDNKVDGVIFSKADLTFNGEGTLNITANYKHAIVSKDELVFTGGTYNLKAVKDTINGKNCVKVKDGTFNLSTSGGNGIQSKNGDDTTKGYVYISGGIITVTKCREGIEGTAILIEGGKIDITAQDDGLNSASKAASAADTNLNDNTVPAVSGSTDTTSAKDLEAAAIQLSSNNTAAAQSSGSAAAAGADSVTGQTSDSGTDATSSASLDGNGQGGDFGGRMDKGGFGGGGAFENDTNCYISISGGSLTVNASGDGIDSNGSLYVSGGDIYVSGPTESMNGGLDYNGTADITGGTIVVAGSVGMAQGFSDTSTQYSILYNFTSSIAAGTEITLTDKAGNVITTYTPDKLYQSVVISTPQLTDGETYTLTCGDQTAEITLDSVVTSNGQQGMGFPGKGGQGQGRTPGQGFGPGQGTQPDQGTQPGQDTQSDQGTTTDPGNGN